MNTCVSRVPSVYLFRLGTVGALRNQLMIPKQHRDEHIVLKYGRTVDLRRRTGEHARSFRQRLSKSELDLVYHSLVHPSMLVEAERKIELWFKETELYLQNETYTELAIAPRKVLRADVRKEYERLSYMYGAFN